MNKIHELELSKVIYTTVAMMSTPTDNPEHAGIEDWYVQGSFAKMRYALEQREVTRDELRTLVYENTVRIVLEKKPDFDISMTYINKSKSKKIVELAATVLTWFEKAEKDKPETYLMFLAGLRSGV